MNLFLLPCAAEKLQYKQALKPVFLLKRPRIALLHRRQPLPETPVSVLFHVQINSTALLTKFPSSFHSLVVGSGARPGEAQGRVGVELAANAVGGGTEGDEEDGANGEQLDGDLLEGTDALGDSVRCAAVLVGRGKSGCSCRWVRTGVLLLLRDC